VVYFVNYNAYKRDFEIIFSSHDSAIHVLHVKLISLAISLNVDTGLLH